MENADAPGVDGGGSLKGVDSPPRSFTSDEPDRGGVNEMLEAADGVAAPANAGDDRIRKASLPLQKLRLDFL